MANLVLGPLLRYVGEREATVWVEVDAPCDVEVLGHSARTFRVRGHHYALVQIEGLEPGSQHQYEVLLDGERRWPLPADDVPPSLIRTIDPESPLTLAFGSCRVSLPHERPYTCARDEDDHGFELDALDVMAREMIRGTRQSWPDLLMLLGDQVYVDEGSELTATAVWQVPGDIGRRYAGVSGDRNPIHMHPLSARAFGFPTAIAHGMWSKARCLASFDGRLPPAYAIEVEFGSPLRVPAKARFLSGERDSGFAFRLETMDGRHRHLLGSISPAT